MHNTPDLALEAVPPLSRFCYCLRWRRLPRLGAAQTAAAVIAGVIRKAVSTVA